MAETACETGPGRRRWLAVDSPWPWLAYLVFYFLPWLLGRTPSPADLIATAVALPIFLAAYFYSFRRPDRRAIPAIGIMLALGFALYPVTVTANTFVIYAAATAAHVRPRRLALAALAAIAVLLAVFSLTVAAPLWYWAPAAFFGTMASFGAMLSAEIIERNKALLASQKEIRHLAATAERERIARDLHDLLGHTLSVVALKAELAGKLLPADPARAKTEIDDIRATARHALADIRAAVSGMRRTRLSEEIAVARNALAAFDIHLDFVAAADELPASIEATLVMLVREGVTNVLRHSDAEHCTIRVESGADGVSLRIEDDGRGGVAAEGNGIAGMRSRVAELGGAFHIESSDGTRIAASFPLASAA